MRHSFSGFYPLAGQIGSVWTAQDGGERIVDLLDPAGNPADHIYSCGNPPGHIEFQGPDDGTSVLYADFGSERMQIVAHTAFGIVVDETSPGVYPSRPAGAALVIWRGTTTPGAAASGDIFINTGA